MAKLKIDMSKVKIDDMPELKTNEMAKLKIDERKDVKFEEITKSEFEEMAGVLFDGASKGSPGKEMRNAKNAGC